MVSAVLEDLKERWSMDRIQEDQAGAHRLAGGEYPWANITFLISGEADSECARVSKLTGAAVLTNDSDFLIHDLGSHGAVVLLNSVQLQESQQADEAEIRGLRLHPRHISRRLGIKNIQRFGFELKRNSHLSLPELLRQSMEHLGTTECSADYNGFLQEYQHREESSLTLAHRPYIQLLDPRVSELFWQYERPEVYCGTEPPHLYLGILHEDHARRCAWEQGRSYRALGYALLNLSRPVTARFPVVHEFVRRGGRIIAEKVTLGGAKRVAADLVALKMRLDLARTIFDDDHRLSFWVFFALSEIYRDATNATTRPSAVHLERFLQSGSMGQKTDWADIHLVAQIHAVLYSLRILKQLLGIARNKDLLDQNHAILASLPPLRRLIGSQYEMIRSFTDGNLAHSIHQFFKTYG
ncbi:uncharacterized protein N7459_000768 [Penicillium hispanicum]|uniref:uncharacterized protein n=1 Tax=Penicillium hispanicum TaxID=1080232 RepID=UPI00253FA0FB|nr:uncharacterized protein N7459_000768 [Penicillium hispanicum]KAJ5594560.1 hypothetical protein N7459_000768 [Penicillium hispanicum]